MCLYVWVWGATTFYPDGLFSPAAAVWSQNQSYHHDHKLQYQWYFKQIVAHEWQCILTCIAPFYFKYQLPGLLNLVLVLVQYFHTSAASILNLSFYASSPPFLYLRFSSGPSLFLFLCCWTISSFIFQIPCISTIRPSKSFSGMPLYLSIISPLNSPNLSCDLSAPPVYHVSLLVAISVQISFPS